MFLHPETTIRAFEVTPEMHIGDMGAGSGVYTMALARALPKGKVYAFEVQREVLERLKIEAQKSHLMNIEGVWANMEKRGGTKVRDQLLDGVLIANVLFQIEDKEGFFSEVTRILKHKGKVFLIDWTDSFGAMGPSHDAVITEEKAKEMFMQKGFIFERSFPAGNHHYGMIFNKS
jgi:ubiquinone/menaquinone biosynthesis C-methylase UbiE